MPTVVDIPQANQGRDAPVLKSGMWGGYCRSLTPDGSIHIAYRDLDLRWWVTALRVTGWVASTGGGLWLVWFHTLLPWWEAALLSVAMGLVNWLIFRRPPKIAHSLELRPDCLVVDDDAVFWLSQMGDPQITFETARGDRPGYAVCGIYGTRFIQYATSHRLDENDRTPDVLAADVQDAIEQIWSRADFLGGAGPL